MDRRGVHVVLAGLTYGLIEGPGLGWGNPVVLASLIIAVVMNFGSYFFSDYVAPPLSCVRGIRKVAPGQYLVWKGGAIQDQGKHSGRHGVERA